MTRNTRLELSADWVGTVMNSGLYYKSFTIVIYNRKDSTIIEP
jgi:hypothetical protein